MTLLERDFTTVELIDEKSSDHPLGCFFVFVTEHDAHSPVMLTAYDELFEYYEKQIPLLFVNCWKADPDSDKLVETEGLEKYLVYSVPTLLWVRGGTILKRQVGTVMVRKLKQECDEVLENIL